MKLFLASSTITPNLVEPFEKFIDRSSIGLRAAFIPDAGFETKGDKAWIDEEMSGLIKDLKWEVNRVVLADQDSVSLKNLSTYDVIYVNGGYSGYLAEVMRKVGFDKLLPGLLNQGVIYVGSSAGSMVLSKVQDAASFYFGEPEPNALTIGGLGLVDFEFYPMHDHRWTEGLVDKIKEKRDKKLKYFLVKDGQAVSVEDGEIAVYGEVITLDAIE